MAQLRGNRNAGLSMIYEIGYIIFRERVYLIVAYSIIVLSGGLTVITL